MMYTLGSLFDGAGTCPFAAQQYGIDTLWTSEIEPFPLSVTRERFPNAKQLGDVTEIRGSEIDPVDIISFGSPCQDLSIAGKREGLSGERSGLFMEAVRIIKEMRGETSGEYPKLAIWENVPGAFSSNKGEDFRVVLEELSQVKNPNIIIPRSKKWSNAGLISMDGGSLAWRVLDAQFWGVPQRRRRIYLVVDFGGDGAGKILFERKGLSRSFAESRAAWKGFARTVKDRANGKVWDHNNRVTDYTALVVKEREGCAGGGKGALWNDTVSYTLSTRPDEFVAYPDAIRRLTPTECARLQGMPDWWCDNIPHTDSAEYKMWGNGMALPCVMYVLEGARNLLRCSYGY